MATGMSLRHFLRDIMLTLMMAVKNGISDDANVIRTIECVNGVVDMYMIGIDDRTTDDTRECLDAIGIQHHDFEWPFNHSKARNMMLEQIPSGTVLYLDADETLDADALISLKMMMDQQKEDVSLQFKVLMFARKSFFDGKPDNLVSEGFPPYPDYQARVCPHTERMTENNPVHGGFARVHGILKGNILHFREWKYYERREREYNECFDKAGKKPFLGN